MGHVFLEGEIMSIDGVLKRLGAASALGCKHGSQASWGEWDTLNLLILLTWVRWASWGGLFGKLLISIKGQWSRRPHYGPWPKSDAPVHQKADTVLYLWPPVLCVAVTLGGQTMSLGSSILQRARETIFPYSFYVITRKIKTVVSQCLMLITPCHYLFRSSRVIPGVDSKAEIY